MKHSSGPRKSANLSEPVHRHLNMYALAAGAAGVGLFAVAHPAQARIVYTKTHQVIGLNGKYDLDLNHDRTVDFVLQQIDYCNSTSCFGFQRHLLAKETPGNAVEGSVGSQGRHFAAALKGGAPIGPRQRFISGGHNGETMLSVWYDQDFQTLHTYGKWNNLNNRYLGLKFKLGRKTHYGWARLSVHNQEGQITGVLTGYAYETIPNKPIIAGKTHGPDVIVKHATLGELAVGRR
jgi:hypothetical protein